MRKFTLIATLLLAFAAVANAGDKIFYKANLSDASVFTKHGNCTYEAGVMTNTSASGGRGYSLTMGAAAYDGVTLPETGYDFKAVFTFNGTGDANKNDFEMTLVPVVDDYTTFTPIKNSTGSCATLENKIFCLTQVYSPNASNGAGTGIAACAVNGTKATTATAPTDDEVAAANVLLTAGTKYSVKVNVAGRTVTYTIAGVAEDGTETTVANGTGSYELAEAVTSTQVGALYGCLSRSSSSVTFESITLSYAVEGDVATDPTVSLLAKVATERDYFVEFPEGHNLHYIVPGGEETVVAYADAIDTQDFDQDADAPGHKIIECYESGTLKVWTSLEADDSNTSNTIEKTVICEMVQFPTPTYTITDVSEGYGKTYTITADATFQDSDPEQKPLQAATITLHYKKTEGGNSAEGNISLGESISFTTTGTLQVYAFDNQHAGLQVSEWYGKSDIITIENNVEYTTYSTTDYAWSKDKCDGTVDGFSLLEIVDNANKSHWDRIYSDQMYGVNSEGSTVAITTEDGYTDIKKGFGFYAGSCIGTDDAKWNVQVPTDVYTAFLPLVPATYESYTENAWNVFPLEGIVYYALTGLNNGNYQSINIESKYVSDDAAKPNFYIVHTRGGYDRPDKGDCNTYTVVTAGEVFNLYRYDTAICDVKIMTYKGFTPGADGIATVSSDIVADKAVKTIENGAVIINKGGKKFNAVGAQIK